MSKKRTLYYSLIGSNVNLLVLMYMHNYHNFGIGAIFGEKVSSKTSYGEIKP